jgi:hypothetical protein
MADRSRQELLEELMDLGLQAFLDKFRDGNVTASELSTVHKMFKDAGLSLALDGQPTSETVESVLEAMKAYEPDYLN